nr:MAG TPA_asm: hypothetical protein [Caudoviricetes sp.]
MKGFLFQICRVCLQRIRLGYGIPPTCFQQFLLRLAFLCPLKNQHEKASLENFFQDRPRGNRRWRCEHER